MWKRLQYHDAGTKANWFFGLFLLICGLLNPWSNTIIGMSFVLAAFLYIPPLRFRVEQKFESTIPRILLVTTTFAMLIMFGVALFT